jgi:CHAT domain-containing protein
MTLQARLVGTSGLLLLAAVAACAPGRDAARDPFATADSLLALRRFAQAHPHYRRLRDSFEVAADTARWWKAQLWWGQTLMRLGRTDSSEAAIARALELAGADPSRRGWTLWLRCGLWSRLGRFDRSLEDCGAARTLAEQAKDGDLLARLHFQMGTIYSRRGLYRLSVAETERALELERRHGRIPHQLAGVLNSMGIEYAAVGRLREAAASYEEGLAITRRLADTSTMGVLLSNLAALRSYTGRLDQAIELMQESLRNAVAVGDSSAMVYARNSLADYYLRSGDRRAARAHLEASLQIGETQVPAVFRVVAIVNLGLLELAEGRADAARGTLERALPPALAGGFQRERFDIHAGLARLAMARRDRATARQHTGLARAVADSTGSPDLELRAAELEGRLRESEGAADVAAPFLRAIDLLESWRGRLALGDLSLGIVEPRWSVYEGAIRTLLAAGHPAAAFEVAERARARMLLELMAEREAEDRGEPVAQLKQRLRGTYQQLDGAADSVRQALDAEIAALTDSLVALERTELARDPRAAARYPRPATLARIRTALLPGPDAALFSLFWGDSAVYGWWVTRDTVVAGRLGRADSLEPALDFLQQSVARAGTGRLWERAATRAWHALLAPLGAVVPARLYAVVDGPVARVPLEVLVPAPGAAPLGVGHEVLYGPSASVLAVLAEAPPRDGWERAMLAVGNPHGGRPSPASEGSRGQPALDLPYAEREARAIQGLYADEGADLLVGRRATVARWLDQRPGRYRYLHFAAHARADDREPDGSRLFLAGGSLDLPAIRALDLAADLVTLSACETALGRRVRGEGVLGLAHAFLAAGARSTVVTLWPVADREAAEFMTVFHRALRAGWPPAAALREVRARWASGGGERAHPSAWASFILLGAPTP